MLTGGEDDPGFSLLIGIVAPGPLLVTAARLFGQQRGIVSCGPSLCGHCRTQSLSREERERKSSGVWQAWQPVQRRQRRWKSDAVNKGRPGRREGGSGGETTARPDQRSGGWRGVCPTPEPSICLHRYRAVQPASQSLDLGPPCQGSSPLSSPPFLSPLRNAALGGYRRASILFSKKVVCN